MDLTPRQVAIADEMILHYLQDQDSIKNPIDVLHYRFTAADRAPSDVRLWTFHRARTQRQGLSEGNRDQRPLHWDLGMLMTHLAEYAHEWDEAIHAECVLHEARSLDRTYALSALITAGEKRPGGLRRPGVLRDAATAVLAKAAANLDFHSRELAKLLRVLLHGGVDRASLESPTWVQSLALQLLAMKQSERVFWQELFEICHESTEVFSSRAPWVKRAQMHCAPVDRTELVRLLVDIMGAMGKSAGSLPQESSKAELDLVNHLGTDRAEQIMIGLARFAASLGGDDIIRALGRLAQNSYRKAPRIGPQAVKVGTATIRVLGQIPGPLAVGQLALLSVVVKQVWAQKSIEAALNAAAKREGIHRSEVVELGIPTYGMSEVGVLRVPIGVYTAELTFTGPAESTLMFRNSANGKRQKSLPASLKAANDADVKELKAVGKDIGRMLAAHRDRIDAMFLDDISWAFEVWRERYLDHPFMGVLARRLVWRLSDRKGETWRSAASLNSSLVSHDGTPLDIDSASALVRLWHPLEESSSDLLAWRTFIESNRINQPFRQVNREVYRITETEQASSRSERFAGRVIRQHQFRALAAQRGWKSKLRLIVADEDVPAPCRILDRHGLRAEFWVYAEGCETNETGSYINLKSGEVRFYPLDAAPNMCHSSGSSYHQFLAPDTRRCEPVPLATVPPLILSEIMRDIDLFVSAGAVETGSA